MTTAKESRRLIRQPGGSVRMFSGVRMSRSVILITFKCDQGTHRADSIRRGVTSEDFSMYKDIIF